MVEDHDRLSGMWDGNPVGVDLKRPMSAFVVVGLLCAVSIVASMGRGDAVLGVFDAPRPIATAAPAPAHLPGTGVTETSGAVTVPAELTARPVGASPGTDDSTALHSSPTNVVAKAEQAEQAEQKAHTRAVRAQRKAEKKAQKKAQKAARKAERRL